MGFFSKKQDTPEEALKKADKTINSGFTGFLTKSFMGQENMNKINSGLDMAKKYQAQSGIANTGMPARAKVIAIQDTGTLINYDPVVKLTLEVQPQFGVGFTVTGDSPVSKIAIPRVGDEINIKYNPTNTNEFCVVQ